MANIEKVELTPMQLIDKAIGAGSMDLQNLEKLMELQERWEKGQAEKAFHLAKNKFQKEKPDLKKSKEVNFGQGTGYKYTPLAKIQKAVDPVLSKHGLSYGWRQEQNGDKIKIICVLSHVKGHSEETWLEAEADTSGSKNKVQAIGSTVSYLKRYTLENALGLSSDYDDDAASSSSPTEAKPTPNHKQWPLIVEKFKTGEATRDDIEENFKLTEVQSKVLDELTNG